MDLSPGPPGDFLEIEIGRNIESPIVDRTPADGARNIRQRFTNIRRIEKEFGIDKRRTRAASIAGQSVAIEKSGLRVFRGCLRRNRRISNRLFVGLRRADTGKSERDAKQSKEKSQKPHFCRPSSTQRESEIPRIDRGSFV